MGPVQGGRGEGDGRAETPPLRGPGGGEPGERDEKGALAELRMLPGFSNGGLLLIETESTTYPLLMLFFLLKCQCSTSMLTQVISHSIRL